MRDIDIDEEQDARRKSLDGHTICPFADWHIVLQRRVCLREMCQMWMGDDCGLKYVI